MTSTPRVVWTRNRRREITQEIVNRHARDGLTMLDADLRDGDTMKLLSNHCKPGRLVALDWHNTIRGNIEFMKCDLEQPCRSPTRVSTSSSATMCSSTSNARIN